MKIVDSYWFTLMSGDNLGIVLVDNGHQKKAYLGKASGHHEKFDEMFIAQNGVKIPVYLFKKIINQLGK